MRASGERALDCGGHAAALGTVGAAMTDIQGGGMAAAVRRYSSPVFTLALQSPYSSRVSSTCHG